MVDLYRLTLFCTRQLHAILESHKTYKDMFRLCTETVCLHHWCVIMAIAKYLSILRIWPWYWYIFFKNAKCRDFDNNMDLFAFVSFCRFLLIWQFWLMLKGKFWIILNLRYILAVPLILETKLSWPECHASIMFAHFAYEKSLFERLWVGPQRFLLPLNCHVAISCISHLKKITKNLIIDILKCLSQKFCI